MTKRFKPRTIIVILIAVFIAGYAYFRSENLLLGPKIVVTSPSNGATMETDLVTISGEAKRIATLQLNGRQIFTDKEGRFSESLLLSYGYNIIELAARDKFGRSTSQTIELVFK